MSGRFLITLGLLVFLGIAGWFSLKYATPKKAEIDAQTPKIEIVSSDAFKNPVINQVKSFTQFGQLPVTIDKNQQGRDNPFAPY